MQKKRDGGEGGRKGREEREERGGVETRGRKKSEERRGERRGKERECNLDGVQQILELHPEVLLDLATHQLLDESLPRVRREHLMIVGLGFGGFSAWISPLLPPPFVFSLLEDGFVSR